MNKLISLLAICLFTLSGNAQTAQRYYLLADRVFDGEVIHEGWAVIVEGDKIIAAGPRTTVKEPAQSIRISYPNSTLLPGLIEGHSHMLLYPYNITEWDTQVSKESDSYRTARATVHAKNTLMAGFTTARDLGSEGAGYSDVGLKRAINEKVIPGPRLLVAGRAIVATGSYGPKGYDDDQHIMLGAEPADGPDLARVVRDQIGKGADLIKVYADYRWGVNNESKPTFTLDELKLINEVAQSSGRPLVCHANTKEAMRRAILAGAETIEHGDEVDAEIGKLMKEHNVTFIPTLAATEMIAQYRGWVKGKTAEPAGVTRKKKAFREALAAGVTIGMGGDVGVFTHGENALEMELMTEYGMKPLDVLKAATSINAKAFHLDGQVGAIKEGLKADVIIVTGDPSKKISDLRLVKSVMKDGIVYREEK